MRARGSALSMSLILLACSGGDRPPDRPTGEPPAPGVPPSVAPPAETPAEPPIDAAANFDIVDDSFVDERGNRDREAAATVTAGQVVSWTHEGEDLHRVEFSRAPPGAASPDSGDLLPGRTWELRPQVPGTYVFFCRYHEPMMGATITVVEGS